MIVLSEPAQTPPAPLLHVKAVVVENQDGKGDRFISGRALASLAQDHPEVLAQLGG